MGVYIIKEEFGLYKIGIARNVTKRFCSLQSGYPYRLKLIHYKSADSYFSAYLEAKLHRIFESRNVRGGMV